jgi:flagellar hook-basal body complex protein FliE
MTIPAISALTSALPTLSVAPANLATSPTGATGAGVDFASILGKGLQAVETSQSTADNLAIKAATGNLTDIHDYTIAATQASLLTELATTLRTKGVDAINTIMGMQA